MEEYRGQICFQTPLHPRAPSYLHPLRSRFEETLEAERGAAAAKVEGFQREVRLHPLTRPYTLLGGGLPAGGARGDGGGLTLSLTITLT